MKLLRLLWLLLLSTCFLIASAQEDAVKWKVRLHPADARAGEAAQLIIEADIRKDYHIYGTVEAEKEPRPIATKFTLDTKDATAGKTIEPEAVKIKDPNFDDQIIGTHTGPTAFALPIKINAGVTKLAGTLTTFSQACNESQCLLPQTTELKLDLPITAGEARADRTTEVTTVPDQPEGHVAGSGEVKEKPKEASEDENTAAFNQAAKSGILQFFLFAFLAGIAALATPCVFPMIPVTVSFFSKQGEGSSRLKGALAYCFGIIGTFVGLGLIVGYAFGGAGLNKFAASAGLNIALAIVFLVLALSLFGLFEIQIPSGLANKLNAKGHAGGGLIAPIIMGVTFTLTTFTCTVAFIGTLLAQAVALGPVFTIAGMLGFSLAFALPFFFFAMFPAMLSKLPKSGSWMVTFKGFLGFVEVMAALKFFSNADLVMKTGLLPRDRFLYVWAALALGAAIYLAGVIRKKGMPKPTIGWFRWTWVALSLVGAFIFAKAGATGTSLGEFEGLMPPEKDTAWSEDLAASKALALKDGKLLFIDFTGVSCTNCRWMEKNMFPRNNVKLALGKHVLVKLYCDRPGDEPNAKLLKETSNAVSMPTYVVIDPATMKPLRKQLDMTRDEAKFVRLIEGK